MRREEEKMNYSQVLSNIHNQKKFSTTASLERISRLMERLGNPQNQIRCIHVAGTNGKGSVCALVEAALRQAGYRVGLFTSPYLVDFRERIQIDRKMITEDQLISCYETVMKEEVELEKNGYEPINEFELVTAIGFVAFATAQVDFAIIEVGLGGRYDATNVIAKPEVCCITPISLDHTAVLGNTVSAIAKEKAGILKQKRPVVISQQNPDAFTAIYRTAKALQCPVITVQESEQINYTVSGQKFRYKNHILFLPLLGSFQAENATTAWEICQLLGLEPDVIQKGFSKVVWKGRIQYVAGSPEILIDAGHNPAGISVLCNTIETLFEGEKIITVMAMMQDKDFKNCISMIAKKSNLLIATTTSLPRSLAPEALAAEAAPHCNTIISNSVADGISVAREIADENSLIVVCGSVYAAGDALRTI